MVNSDIRSVRLPRHARNNAHLLSAAVLVIVVARSARARFNRVVVLEAVPVTFLAYDGLMR
jgi:hypothetical protein